MSPVRFDDQQASRYFRGHHSPSRYDVDDPYVRSLSPVRYEQRSPARSRHDSDPDIVGVINLGSTRREIPTRDLSSMLSPRYPDSRQTSPRGARYFFPDTESLQSSHGDRGPPDRVSSEDFGDRSTEDPAERDVYAGSRHSGDFSRYEGQL